VAFVVAVEVGTAMVVAVIVLVIVVATIVFSYYGLMDILLHPPCHPHPPTKRSYWSSPETCSGAKEGRD